MSDFDIWLSPPDLTGNERKYVSDVFDSNWIAPAGPHINKFENKLGLFLKSKNVVALSSGTAAIHLSLQILGVKRGDFVICQSLTFVGSANPILYCNAEPIFIDSETETWNMCPLLLEKAINDSLKINKKPKAIILVHLYGMPAKINEIKEISKKYDIPLIEDAAEALGSNYDGIPLGTIGDFGILSFNGNKIITTSGGGALISSNLEHSKKAKFLSSQAKENTIHYQHKEIGYNYRISNVLAAIGLGQIEQIDKKIKIRRKNFSLYKKYLNNIEEISFLEEPLNFYSNRWITTILVSSQNGFCKEKIIRKLRENKIESRPIWKPMHLQPLYKQYKFYNNNSSEKLFNLGLCLPSGTTLTEEQISKISQIIISSK